MLETVYLTQFKPAGTKSFRLSATKAFGEYGGNAQNPDKSSLELYVARPGHVVAAQQIGVEAVGTDGHHSAGGVRIVIGICVGHRIKHVEVGR